MGHTASDTASARPEIFHRIGTTDTQYDILDQDGTLASGDCKPNHATETDEYVCLYTVGGSDTGAFTVKVGTNSADEARNALAAAYTHATTLTLDTTAPAAPVSLGATAGDAQVELTWSEPSPADASIAKWQVRHKSSGSYGSWADVSGGASARSHTVTSLENGTAYTFQVRAVDAADNEGAAGTAGPSTPQAADTTPPTISTLAISSSPPAGQNGHYRIGDAVAVTATFSEALVLSGTPTLKIKVGAVEKSADCALKGTSGDDAKKLVCSYTVAEGDADTDGVAVEAGKLAGTIKDGADNAATLTYTAVPDSSGHKVDGVKPTVTAGSTGYFSDAAATTALTGPQKSAADIFTKVTFSEDMGHVKGDGSAGRPELFHRIGSTDTRYDILNHGDTLASGDCKPTDASETDEYVCRYTVGGSDNGAFTVKVGTNSADEASNALAAEYTHSDTLRLDTTAPTVTAGSTGYYSDAALSNALTEPQKSGAEIYTKVTFSEDMGHTKSDEATARPEIFRRIGTTDVQYDILDQDGTLASGDCKPNHASETDEYVCLYTVGGSDNGAFTVKVGTNSADEARNALAAAYTHATTLTLDTVAPAAPVSLGATAGDAQVELTWSEPSPADASIAKWQVRHKSSGSYGSWADVSGGASARSHTVTSLENGTAYTFQVRAVDAADNEGAAGTAGPSTPQAADTTPPTISTLAISSSPPAGQNGHYGIGDAVAVTATFSEALVLSGTPTLKIKVGAVEKSADCALKGTSGDDAKKLVCSYTVAEGDADTDGVSGGGGQARGHDQGRGGQRGDADLHGGPGQQRAQGGRREADGDGGLDGVLQRRGGDDGADGAAEVRCGHLYEGDVLGGHGAREGGRVGGASGAVPPHRVHRHAVRHPEPRRHAGERGLQADRRERDRRVRVPLHGGRVGQRGVHGEGGHGQRGRGEQRAGRRVHPLRHAEAGHDGADGDGGLDGVLQRRGALERADGAAEVRSGDLHEGDVLGGHGAHEE